MNYFLLVLEHISCFMLFSGFYIYFQDCIKNKITLPEIENSNSCLVPIYIKLQAKGSLKRNALICLPELSEINTIKTVFEPYHKDNNEDLRKTKRKEHIKKIKSQKRKRNKQRKANNVRNIFHFHIIYLFFIFYFLVHLLLSTFLVADSITNHAFKLAGRNIETFVEHNVIILWNLKTVLTHQLIES